MQIPIPYTITKEYLDSLFKMAIDGLHKLSKTVLEGINPPPGAYAFFSHNSHALSRVEDIKGIVHRLIGEVHTLVFIHVAEHNKMTRRWPFKLHFPDNIQAIRNSSEETNKLAQLDMESLYIFSQILLDQWSLIAIAVGNLPLKKAHPFSELVEYLQNDSTSRLTTVWDACSTQILWLHYQVRFYRNRFIIHANRPWQRGTTRSVLGEEYNLFTPTPPGWLDDKKLDEEIKKLLPLTPPRIRDAADDYWEKARAGRIIEVLFNEIGNIPNKDDREKIAELFGKKGGSTPTFQIITKNLLEFIIKGTELITKIADENLTSIDIGRPAEK